MYMVPKRPEGACFKSVYVQREGKTTVLEVLTTRELGDPFRRDAMRLPQRRLAKYAATNEEAESRTGQPTDIAGAGAKNNNS